MVIPSSGFFIYFARSLFVSWSIDKFLRFYLILSQPGASVQGSGIGGRTAAEGLFIHFFQRDTLMFEVKVQQGHCFPTAWAFQRVVSKGCGDAVPPAVKGKECFMFFLWRCAVQFFVAFPAPV